MAGFLRRKSKVDEKQTNSSYNTRDSRSTTSVSSVPPLYARFTSASVKQDDSATPSRPMVSGPMSLASTRRAGPGSPANGQNKGKGADDRRLINGNGKWNESGYDVRTQIGQSNPAASGSGYLTADAYPPSPTTAQPHGLSPASRAGSGAQPRRALVGSFAPSSASHLSPDKSLPTGRVTAEASDHTSVPSTPPIKDRRLSKSFIPTRIDSPSTANGEKPLPVPNTTLAAPSSLPSAFDPYSQYVPNIPPVLYTEPQDTGIRGKESKSVPALAPRYPQSLAQHLLSKVDKDLPPQPPADAPTPSTESAVAPSVVTSNSSNHTTPSHRVADPPSPRKAQFPSLSRMSLSRSSPPKSQPQSVQPFPISGHVSSKSLDRPSLVQRGFENATISPAAPRSRLFSGSRLPSVSGILSKTKDKGKGVAQIEDPAKAGSISMPLENKVTQVSNEASGPPPPHRRTPSQESKDTSASHSSSSNTQHRKSHYQQASSGDFWPQAAPRPIATTSASEFSTTSVGTMGTSGDRSIPSSVSVPIPPPLTRGSEEARRPSNSTIPPSPPHLSDTPPPTNTINPPRRSDSLPVTDNVDHPGQNRNNLVTMPPSALYQEVRRVANSKASHARQTSMPLRKGPLIFAANVEPEVSDPLNIPTPSDISGAQMVSNKTERLRSMYGDVRSDIDAYPSPPTESTPFSNGASARIPQPQGALGQPARDHKTKDRPPQNSRAHQPPPQPEAQSQLQSHPLYPSLPQTQPFPSQLPRRQMPTANFQPHPEHSQPSLQPDSSAVSSNPNDRDRIPSDTQSKSRHVLTKARQASAIPQPTIPPVSPRKPKKQLDLSIAFDNQVRQRRSEIPGNSNRVATGLDYTDQGKPHPVAENASLKEDPPKWSLKENPSGIPGIDHVVMKRRTQANLDIDANPNIPPTLRAPPTPVSPEEPVHEQFREQSLEQQPSLATDVISQRAASAGPYDPVTPKARPRPMTVFSMTAFDLCGFLSDAGLLFNLLSYLTFQEWIILSAISKQIRTQLQEERDLREEVLERYLETIGYERWAWEEEEPLPLSLQDLNDYMRGVSMPNHQYARLANQCVQLWKSDPTDIFYHETMRDYTASTRAYSRVVLRLRVQAEAAEAEYIAQRVVQTSSTNGPVSAYSMPNSFSSNQTRSYSRPSSRAPSPAMSMFSNSHQAHVTVANHTTGSAQTHTAHRGFSFRSPLFKLRRAPLLRVFVPSPDGDWLSDQSVLECEGQLKLAGVLKLLRTGDVVWDVAVGDEGNVGRLIWDGNFLIDLDYSYSRAGDLPQYLHTLTFPPSYFHRVIRTSPANSMSGSNPIVHIDISPWGEEVAANLQLLQDRMRTETPQGSHHNVVRWVHRSSFVIRPPPVPIAARYGPNRTRIPPVRIPIPQTDNLYVDPGWYGTIVVEAEGTNEGLADLQERCGSGVFPPRARPVIRNPGNLKPRDGRKVFRLLREKSRQGEIWLRSVREKERLM